MMSMLVPPTIRVCESTDTSSWRESSLPDESAGVAKAVPRRRLEHGAVRELARRALADLGAPPTAILSGPDREPLWPDGVVGSLTHCDGYCAAAVASCRDILTVGIDAELATPLDDRLVDVVCTPRELARLQAFGNAAPDVPWTKVAFSVKEATYKAWFPVTGRWLNYDDVDLVFDANGRFITTVLVDAPPALTNIGGWFSVGSGLVRSAAVVPRR